MSYSRFNSAQVQRALEWARGEYSNDDWEIGAPVGRGISNSHHITCKDGTRGVAKQAFDFDLNPSGAHEKIAADLAHHLDIPVPPVRLWTDPVTGTPYAISAWAFDQTISWEEAEQKGALTPEYVNATVPFVTAGTVLHTWIGDGDRNPGNTVIDVERVDPAIAFIDHAFGFSKNWREGGPYDVFPAVHHYMKGVTLDRVVVEDCIRRVQSLEHAAVRGIVERIAPAYLSSERAHLIVTHLVQRQATLAKAFGIG